jgi:hypothetical protein
LRCSFFLLLMLLASFLANDAAASFDERRTPPGSVRGQARNRVGGARERIVWGAGDERRHRRLRALQRIVSSPGLGLRPNAAAVLSGAPHVCPPAHSSPYAEDGCLEFVGSFSSRIEILHEAYGELRTAVGKSVGSGAGGTSRWWGVHR